MTMTPNPSLPARFRRGLLVASCLVCAPALAQVQPAQAPANGSADSNSNGGANANTLRGFSVLGDNPLSASDTSLVLAPFLRKELSLDTFRQATAALETLLANKGFALHKVVLPPQEVSDTLMLQVVRFAIGTVTVDDSGDFGRDNILRSLPELREGGTPSFTRLAVQTALANDNPAKKVQVALKASEDNPDTIDAAVRVKATSPVQLSASLTNTGTAATGRDRFTLVGSHANLFGLDHQVAAAYTTSLERQGDVHQWGLTYRVPFYALGGMLDASYTDSNVTGQFGTFTSTGAGRTLGVSYTQHFGAHNGLNRLAVLGWEDKVFDPTQLNGVPLAGQMQRRSRPLSLSFKANRQTDTSYWDAGVSLSANLPQGSASTLAAYQSERPAVTTASWRAWRFSASRVDSLPGGWLLSGRMQGQWASTALIAGEQFGIGGAGGLRGVNERALAADAGVATALELTSPEWTSGLRTLAFADMGWLHHKAAAAGTSAKDSAATVGLGVRYTKGAWALALDRGQVVKPSRQPLTLNPNAPRRGEHKWHLNVMARF